MTGSFHGYLSNLSMTAVQRRKLVNRCMRKKKSHTGGRQKPLGTTAGKSNDSDAQMTKTWTGYTAEAEMSDDILKMSGTDLDHPFPSGWMVSVVKWHLFFQVIYYFKWLNGIYFNNVKVWKYKGLQNEIRIIISGCHITGEDITEMHMI